MVNAGKYITHGSYLGYIIHQATLLFHHSECTQSRFFNELRGAREHQELTGRGKVHRRRHPWRVVSTEMSQWKRKLHSLKQTFCRWKIVVGNDPFFLRRPIETLQIMLLTPLKTNIAPENDGWKVKIPFKMVPFEGTCSIYWVLWGGCKFGTCST